MPVSRNYYIRGRNLIYLFFLNRSSLKCLFAYSLKVYGLVVIFGWYKYPDPGPAVFVNFLVEVAVSPQNGRLVTRSLMN